MASRDRFSPETLSEVSTLGLKMREVSDHGTKKTIGVGRFIKASSFYHAPGREAKLSAINIGIHVYADWQEKKLPVFSNPEKTQIYAEIDSKYSGVSDAVFFAEQEGDNSWQLFYSYAATDAISYAAAIIAAVKMDLLQDVVSDYDGTTRENSYEFFCDAIQHGFYQSNDLWLYPSTCDTVTEKFAETSLDPLFSPFEDDSSFEKTAEVDIDGYFTWESCLKGEHRLDYDWAPEAKPYIPALSTLDKFVPTKEFISMLVHVEQSFGRISKRMADGLVGEDALGDDVVNLKLSGPPGSGKSFALKCLAAVLGMPFWVTSFNPNSDESFAEGKTRMVGSEPRHTDAPLTMCQMYGGISAGEEPNTGDPEMIFGVYSQIVESPYTLYRNGCEAVIRHPLSVYAILYNKNCGSATMHAALLNRFNQPFKFKPAEKDEFISMLMKKSGRKVEVSSDIDTFYNEFATRRKKFRKTPAAVCDWIYRAYNSVINSLDNSSGRDAAEAISLRSCAALLQSIQDGEDPMSALRCLTDNIGDFDEEMEEAVNRALQSSLPRL